MKKQSRNVVKVVGTHWVGTDDWRMRARRRPDRIWSIEVKRIFRQKRYTKVFGKKASERERHLNGNYALCTHYALLMH